MKSVSDEAVDQLPASSDVVHGRFCRNPQFKDILCNEVGHLVILGIPPRTFYGIGIRSVGRKMEYLYPRISLQERLDRLSPVDSCSVHEQEDLSGDPLCQKPQETDHIRPFEILVGWKESEQEAGATLLSTDGDAGDGRDLGAPIPGFQDRRFPFWGECPLSCWEELEAGFIDENDRRLFPAGFFLMAGNSFFRQTSTSPSRRSRAIFSGFWELQPSFRVRILNTWST